MRIEEGIYLDFQDVLIKPKRSTLKSRSEVSLIRKFKFKWSSIQREFVPIIAANMSTTGTVNISKVMSEQKMITCMHKFITDDDVKEMQNWESKNPGYLKYVALTTGTLEQHYQRLQELLRQLPQIDMICLDIANGYGEHFVDFVRRVRLDYPNNIIIAGNVATPEMTEALILAGADIAKIGLGPGSACITRKVTGVGVPQLSAASTCADAAHGLDGMVISDGGCNVVGDISKALCCGADFVMLGGMLAGHDESGGEIVYKDNKPYIQFYGMSSKKANDDFAGGLANYRSSEGRELLIPYKGPLINTLLDIQGGLRSTCTYIGAKTIKQMPKCATFIRVNNQLNKSLEKYET